MCYCLALGSDDVVDMNQRAWERVADWYNARAQKIVGSLFGDFIAHLRPRGQVLDVGSGTGLPYARALVEGGFDVLGVDVSSRMVELARGHVPQARFMEMSMTEMRFEDEFDGVLAVYSMLLLDPPLFRAVGERVVKALKRGGVFYLVLSEPWEEGANLDGELVVEIMEEAMYFRSYSGDGMIIEELLRQGEEAMYFRDYSVKEVRRVFFPLGLEEVSFRREVHVADDFGLDFRVEFLFRK